MEKIKSKYAIKPKDEYFLKINDYYEECAKRLINSHVFNVDPKNNYEVFLNNQGDKLTNLDLYIQNKPINFDFQNEKDESNDLNQKMFLDVQYAFVKNKSQIPLDIMSSGYVNEDVFKLLLDIYAFNRNKKNSLNLGINPKTSNLNLNLIKAEDFLEHFKINSFKWTEILEDLKLKQNYKNINGNNSLNSLFIPSNVRDFYDFRLNIINGYLNNKVAKHNDIAAYYDYLTLNLEKLMKTDSFQNNLELKQLKEKVFLLSKMMLLCDKSSYEKLNFLYNIKKEGKVIHYSCANENNENEKLSFIVYFLFEKDKPKGFHNFNEEQLKLIKIDNITIIPQDLLFDYIKNSKDLTIRINNKINNNIIEGHDSAFSTVNLINMFNYKNTYKIKNFVFNERKEMVNFKEEVDKEFLKLKKVKTINQNLKEKLNVK